MSNYSSRLDRALLFRNTAKRSDRSPDWVGSGAFVCRHCGCANVLRLVMWVRPGTPEKLSIAVTPISPKDSYVHLDDDDVPYAEDEPQGCDRFDTRSNSVNGDDDFFD